MYHPEVESATRKKLEEIQLTGIQATHHHMMKNVAAYRRKIENAYDSTLAIRKLEDVSQLPFMSKQDLRDGYPYGMFAVPIESVSRIHGSSGTSGKPTIVGYTEADLDYWSDMVARAITAAGGRKGDMLLNAYGYGLFTGGLGLHGGAEKLGLCVIPMSGGNTDRQITMIQDFRPRGICCTPSYIVTIAEKMEEKGIDPKSTSLEFGIFGAEPWTDELRAIIEDKLAITAVDIYGASELIGPGVAIECGEYKNGLHIAEDHFYVEVIDPDTLQPVQDGEEGELVFTSLKKEALPLVRYRTGDIASINKGVCACGRTTARMSRVKGRVDDMLVVKGVNLFPTELERVLVQFPELVPHYQVKLIQKGILESLQLHVEIDERIFAECAAELHHPTINELKRSVQKQIKSDCYVTLEVLIQAPGTIPRSEGKAIRILKA
ncbi:MAG: phenylacetate--CoA ligase family protein [Bacillus sp. (in: firmicutes)]